MAKKHNNNQQTTNYTYTETKKYNNPQQHLNDELAIDENIKIIDIEVYNDIIREMKRNHDIICDLIDKSDSYQKEVNDTLFWNNFWSLFALLIGITITAMLFMKLIG